MIDVRRNPATKRQIQRAIEAARAAGLRVVAVRPDGTVETAEKDNSGPSIDVTLTNRLAPRDARELLG